MNDIIDIAIIGADIAGLTASIAAYFYNPDLKIEIFGHPYNSTLSKKGIIENVPGSQFEGVRKIEEVLKQLEQYEIPVFREDIHSIDKIKEGFKLNLENKIKISKTIILALDLSEQKYTIDGEEKLEYKGVSHCAICDGALYRGKKVVIIGNDNHAAKGALFLKQYCRKVTILAKEELKCDKLYNKRIQESQNITLVTGADVQAIVGQMKVEEIRYTVNEEEKTMRTDGVFIELKKYPDLSLLDPLGIKFDDEGYIVTNHKNQSSIEGMFVAGVLNKREDYIVILAGDGYVAGFNAAKYLD